MRADNLTDPSRAERASEFTIAQWLAHGRACLAGRAGAAHLEAELLLSHALDRPRSYLVSHAHSPVPVVAAAAYQRLLERAEAGEPSAYLLGVREFWSLSLAVSPAVLVPRPETELVVERCLAIARTDRALDVCDLGTGSGAIALALASERPRWRITATDRSAAALEIARANGQRLRTANVEFRLGDWLRPLEGRSFDLIVSNPPYVSAEDPALQALHYEPPAALTPGPTGLEALRHIVVEAPRHLVPGGALVLEHGAQQAQALARLLRERGYRHIVDHRDLAGRDRVMEALWP